MVVPFLRPSTRLANRFLGSADALKGLLRANALQAFLFAIAHFRPTDLPPLRAAFTRALRAIAVAIADSVGPPQGGLQIHPSDARDEATVALNNLFEVLCAPRLCIQKAPG